MKIPIGNFLFFFLNWIVCFSQAPVVDTLPDPDPNFITEEYELIILDGDTLLRSNITKELYNKNFRKIERGAGLTISTDWMNTAWNTKLFNPYDKDVQFNYPLEFSFEKEVFTMPIDGRITSRYGWRRGRAHKGIDIDLNTGDNVKVAFDGKVRFAKYYSGFGNVIVVRHNNGLETIYAHLSKILAEPNTYVYSGQVIGKGGNTGRSTGSHLHFEIRFQNKAIHPEYFIDFDDTKGLRATKFFVDERWANPRKHRSYQKSKVQVKTDNLYQPKTTTTDPFIKPTTDNHSTTIQLNDKSSEFKKENEGNSFKKQNVVEPKYHIVKRGETLGRIAKKYNTTITELCRLNNIKKSSILKIGQQLQVK